MTNRLIEHLFFFGSLGFVVYLMWQIFSPFLGALALAAIITTICYPAYTRLIHRMPRKNTTLAALLSVLLVILIVFLPLLALGYLLFVEAAAFYTSIESGATISLESSLNDVEYVLQQFVPGMTLDVSEYAGQAARWLASNIGTVFAGTASTLFLFFIMLIGLFYMFRDGEKFTRQLVSFSPLPDDQDTRILKQLSRAVRSVVLGTLTVAIIQGILTAIGFTLFGINQAILWGSVAAIGALIPGVGTTIVFLPAIVFLFISGAYGPAIGLLVWGMLAVGLVDNLLGPYLVSRGVTLHPFLILLSVLGGIALFGPVGFIIGPVSLALLMVLLELYSAHISVETPSS